VHSSSSRSFLHLLRLSVLARDIGMVMANLKRGEQGATAAAIILGAVVA
jgi:hypothetical protein